MIGNIASHHRAGPDHGAFAYGDAGKDCGVAADRGSTADAGGQKFPVRLGLYSSLNGRCARKAIVGEHHAMPDEDLVGDLDTLADKAVGRDFATLTNDRIPLNFDKRPDSGSVTDPASIEIHQIFIIQDDIRSEIDVR